MSILTAFALPVNLDAFEVAPFFAPEADDYRPTAGPDFLPTVEEDAEAAALFGDDDDFGAVPSDDELNQLAGESYALDLMCLGIRAF